jgi:ubiquitin-like-conjugating enzyme ATG3
MDVVRLFRNTREWITPVLHESAFTERGVLTPEEFVRAGDQLVLKCPTWSWQSGDKNKVRPYLPADKQFLLIRGCPSHQRVTTMNAATVQDYAVESDLSGVNDKDGDWCAPQIIENSYDDEVLVDAKDFSNEDTDVASTPSATSLSGSNAVESTQGKTERSENDSLQNNPLGSTIPLPDVGKESLQHSDIHLKAAVLQKDKADEYDDMEDESLALDESATTSNLKSSNGSNTNIDSSSSLSHNSKKESALLRSRRYDVSITYDKYYQVG